MFLMNIFHEEMRINSIVKFVTIRLNAEKVENKEFFIEKLQKFLNNVRGPDILTIETAFFDCNSALEIIEQIETMCK